MQTVVLYVRNIIIMIHFQQFALLIAHINSLKLIIFVPASNANKIVNLARKLLIVNFVC